MVTGTSRSQTRSVLCAPDCCFIDLEITSCTRSFFSWGRAEDEVEDILVKNESNRRRTSRKHGRKLSMQDYPPPVISLSHSTVSNSSSDVSSTFNDSTEERRLGSKSLGLRERVCIRNRFLRKDSCVDYRELSPPPSLSRHSTRDYAALHEMLINSLFEDAQARHVLKMNPKLEVDTNLTPPAVTSPVRSAYPKMSFRKPKSVARKSSTASIASSRTSRSRNSNQSKSSNHSEILTPSTHQFQQTLSKKRRKVSVLPILRRRLLKFKNNKISSSPSHCSGTSTRSCVTPPPQTPPEPAPEELSSCASSYYTNSASSFLHSNCRLQKDKGKGVAPGNAIVALGRHDAMKKLGEKIDLLVNMEQDGSWTNAALKRVPARIMARDPKELEDNINIVESRSMIGIKVGFVSIRYGILIHWNVLSGQADFILLRKMCNDSFLKDRHAGKDKSSTIRTKGVELVRKSSSKIRQRGSADFGTPSFVTVNSNESSCGTEDNSLGPPYLEPI